MTEFRPRKSQGGGGHGGGGGMRRGRGGRPREGMPKTDIQSDLENLPEIDYNHFDKMTPAELLKAAKAAKLSPNLLRNELIEQLLAHANADKEASYARGILEVLNDGWGTINRRTPTSTSANPKSSASACGRATPSSARCACRKRVRSIRACFASRA